MLSNGRPVLTLTLHLSHHHGNWRIVQILVLLTFVVLVCCTVGISAMTSKLKWCTCWSSVLKNCRTRHGAFIARSWWRWHTQHRSLWRPDLVTTSPWCLGCILPWAQTCRLCRSHCLRRLMQQLPSQWRVMGLSARAVLRLLLQHSYQIVFQKSLHVSFCRILHLIPTSGQHTLWINSCVDWRSIASAWVASHHATVLKQLLLRLSVSCQPLLSRSHARGCLPNSLTSDNSGTLNFWPLVIGLFRFSDLWTSLFRLKEHIVEDDATLVRAGTL